MYLAFGMTAAPFSFSICTFSYYGSSHMQMFPVKPPTVLSSECCVALSLFFLNSLVQMTLPCLAHSKRPPQQSAFHAALLWKCNSEEQDKLYLLFQVAWCQIRACNYTWLLQGFHPKSPLYSASGAQWDVICANGIRAMGMKVMIGRGGKMCIYPNHQLRYVKFLCF